MNTEQYCSRHYARYRTGERGITIKDIRDILFGSKDKQIYFPAHFIFELLHNFFLSWKQYQVLLNCFNCQINFGMEMDAVSLFLLHQIHFTIFAHIICKYFSIKNQPLINSTVMGDCDWIPTISRIELCTLSFPKENILAC